MADIIDGEVVNKDWFLASINGDIEYIKNNAGNNIGSIGENNCTALMYAADAGNIECVEFLSHYKEEITKQDINGNTALMYCTKKGHIDCILILAEFESNIYNNDKKRAIDIAREYKFFECMGALSIYETDTDDDDNNNDDDSNSNRDLIKENKRLKNKLNILKSANKNIDNQTSINDTLTKN